MDVYSDGVWSKGKGEPLVKTDPAKGDVVYQGYGADTHQVAKAISSAQLAFEAWAATPQAERNEIMMGYAQHLKARRQDIAISISRDMGKPLWESLTEVDAMVGKVAISITAQTERAGHKDEATAFGSMRLTHRPHGVMAIFGPFNFPGHLPNGHMVPALLAGNVCVFKPSEFAPNVARHMVEALAAAGLPKGVLSVVQGGRETGKALLEGAIDGVLFTGSAETGLFIHQQFAGRPQVILALEMGGNNPLIVWDASDLKAAASIVFNSAYVTTGQRCSCARRFIVPEGAFGNQLIDALSAEIDAVTIGAWDEEVFMGPLVSDKAVKNALSFEAELLRRGAKAIVGFTRPKPEGAFIRPSLIDVTGTDAPDQELFGPLVQVTRAKTFDDALKAANATRFGLAAGLVSDDHSLWQKAEMKLKAGVITLNRATVGAPSSQPFGGPGLSGNHRPGAYYAADYCAWPQVSQTADHVKPSVIAGFTPQKP
jgi:succinylglutamic semialdehyde dehydrogenase